MRYLASGVALGSAGLVLVVTGYLGGTGRLRRNWLLGIRLSTTLRSDDAWLAAHRAAARPMAMGGIAAVFGGALLIGTTNATVARTSATTTTIAMLVLVLLATYRAIRAAERVNRRERK